MYILPVSGAPGICNIYEFLAYHYPDKLDKDVHRPFLARTREDASLVTTNWTPLTRQAVDIFLSSYGAEAGVTALKFMPFGGQILTYHAPLQFGLWPRKESMRTQVIQSYIRIFVV